MFLQQSNQFNSINCASKSHNRDAIELTFWPSAWYSQNKLIIHLQPQKWKKKYVCWSQTEGTLHKWYLNLKRKKVICMWFEQELATITFLILAQATILSISWKYIQFSINKTMFDIHSSMAPRLTGQILYLMVFSVFQVSFWELRDKRNFTNSLGAVLEDWYIECGLFKIL